MRFPFGPLLVGLLLFAPALAQDEEEDPTDDLPLLTEMELPTMKDFLQGQPRDWIVIKPDERVIVAEPIVPRPNTLERLDQQRQEFIEVSNPRNAEERIEYQDKLKEFDYVNLTLPDAEENPEFKIAQKFIERIIHHEDLFLQRIDLTIDEGDLRSAYEMLYQLEKKAPDWPGIGERKHTMLLRQSDLELEKGKPYEALVYLEQLFTQAPETETLQEKAGVAAERLVKQAIDKDDYRKARHYLRRLSKFDIEHPVYKKWASDLEEQARTFLDQSNALAREDKPEESLLAVRAAANIWPQTRGLRSRYDQASRRYQVLQVGVRSLPRSATSYPLPTPADWREEQLLTARFFRINSYDENPHFESNYLDYWDPADLGKRTKFIMQQSKPAWDPRPPLAAVDVVGDIAERIDPEGGRYDERLASIIKGLSVESPTQFTVKFNRAPLRIESLLNIPIMEKSGEGGGFGGTAAYDLLTPRFVLDEAGPNRNNYIRARPQPGDLDDHNLAEITEILYPDSYTQTQALLRNEIQMLLDVDPWNLWVFDKAREFTVVPLSLPVTHLLQVNPRSEKLKNRELRRALSYSINREKLLDEVILKTERLPDDVKSRHGRLVSGPFPSRSYANNPLIQPGEYDPALAFALTFAAKGAMPDKQLPKLTMVCAPDAEAIEAAEQMVTVWKKLGIEVTLVPQDAAPPDDWDLIYRLEQMQEPLTDLWPFLTLEQTARMEDLDYLPDWLRKEIVALDQAANWDEATERLWTLHHFLVSRAEVIPLWEVDRHFVYRTRTLRRAIESDFQGNPLPPLEPYQSAGRWNVEPWYESQ